MTLKQELLQQAERDFAGLQAAIEGLGEVQMTQVWLGTWSVREILAHISSWHREMILALGRMARGERPFPEGVSYEDPGVWNARFVTAKTGVPLAEVVGELEASHRDFIVAAVAVPDARFEPGKAATRILDLNGPHHYREHAAQIREWRRREGS